jgi:hypothetical protein
MEFIYVVYALSELMVHESLDHFDIILKYLL